MRREWIGAAAICALLAAGALAAPPEGQKKRANVVFVLADDLAMNLVQYMPHVQQMQKRGVTFANYFVTDSLCCPSRSSIFTGRYPHDTGVFTNGGSDGGWQTFVARGNDKLTFAHALSAAGVRTAMMGKYLNGYEPTTNGPQPGWAEWDVAGTGYPEFNYDLNENKNVKHYGGGPAAYLTDVLAGLAVKFIKESKGKPFLLEVATFAPHAPYIPAPRDAHAFPGLKAPRTGAYNVAANAQDPEWLRDMPPLTPALEASIDADFRKRAQAVQAVDKLIGELEAAVEAIGEKENTYFIFSSDNGYHMGEHRLRPGKMTAFDTDIHVPLVVMGPRTPHGHTVHAMAENIDLCPTFAELTGAEVPPTADGRSLVPLFEAGEPPKEWRSVILVEHHGPHEDKDDPDKPDEHSGNPPSYAALRSATATYVEYEGGFKDYRDLSKDPNELHNVYSSLGAAQKQELAATVAAIKACHDAASCWAAQRPAHLDAVSGR
jgi:arylsulfatase A-like enzyme